MTNGIGYLGSKSDIAQWVVDHIPPCDTFIDAFAGGCAITHAAILSGKYKHIIANDVNDTPKLFYDAIQGKYANETRWISRDDFFALKDNDPYIRTCWSFGNSGNNYIYGQNIEEYKRGYHYAAVFNDYTPWEAMGITIPATVKDKGQHATTIHQRRLILRGYLIHHADEIRAIVSGIGGDDKHVGDMESLECLQRLQSLERLQRLQRLQSLQSLESLQRLQSLQSLQSLESLQRMQSLQRLQTTPSYQRTTLTVLQGDYQDIPLPATSFAIYCDPPYANTKCGQYSGFDHQRFYAWLRNLNHLAYVSEYAMPDDFIMIDAITKRVKSTGKANPNSIKYAAERLFIHQSQQHNYTPTTLF